MERTSHVLSTPDVDLAYDVTGPLPPDGGRPVLLLVGHPMTARGFDTLAGFFPDRTVVTYDPRGLGRSERKDGSTDRSPDLHAADLHALVEHLGCGPVEVFGSSGGAVTSLELVRAHPHDVTLLVAHEPPILTVLPDAETALAAERLTTQAYQGKGFGAGMARFLSFISWPGEFGDAYLEAPDPDPAAFGLPTDDDGGRDDPILGGASAPITAYDLDVAALQAAPARIVIAAGVESEPMVTWRTSVGVAERLGLPLTRFPSHHGGFSGPEFGHPGQPEAFAARLREVEAGDG